MPDVFSSWRGGLSRWIVNHPFTTLGAIALAVFAVSFCRRQQSEWDQVYLPAAARLASGEDMYRPQHGYLYPPFMAWASVPFLSLPAPAGRFAWFLVNALCLVAMLRWGWRLTGGSRLEGAGPAAREERFAAVLGGLCGLFYLQNCLAHQQTDIVIGAALVGGVWLWTRGRPILAATALGLAAACKCTALLWAPYLLWRGRPWAALWLLVVALGVNLLPDVVHTTPTGRPWLAEYVVRYLKPLTASDHYVGTWASDAVYNQSLSGAGQRWCTTSWTWTDTDCTIQNERPLAAPQVLRWSVYAVEGLVVCIILWNCGRPFRGVAEQSPRQILALEGSSVLMLMLLLSPMSSKAHFGTLIVPGFCLARRAILHGGRFLRAVLLAAIVLGVLSNKDPLGERLYTLSLWYGVVTWQTLLLLAGCLIAIRRERGMAAELALPCPAATDSVRTRLLWTRFTPAWVRKDACRASA